MESDRPSFPMRTVERLTRLTAATIRAWERRYGAIEPARTEGGARRYTAENIRRLILLREAADRGHAIGQIAALDDAALQALADARPDIGAASSTSARQDAPHVSPLVEEYFAEIERYRASGALDLLARAATLMPPRQLVFEVVVPIARETGTRWAGGSLAIAQEHLVTAQLSWLLATLVRTNAPDRRGGRRAIVTTPPDERHALGALIGAFILAFRGFEPIYLGPDLPFAEIDAAARAAHASLVLLSVVTDRDPKARRALATGIRTLARSTEVWLGIPPHHPLLRSHPPATLFHDFHTLDTALQP